MDLYVKLQGLKYNFRKVWGVFVKFQGYGDFLEIMNYFSIKTGVDRVYSLVDWVHEGRCTSSQ
jgi:hypothetical protein